MKELDKTQCSVEYKLAFLRTKYSAYYTLKLKMNLFFHSDFTSLKLFLKKQNTTLLAGV